MVKTYKETHFSGLRDLEECVEVLKRHGQLWNVSDSFFGNGSACSPVWDQLLCWPATAAGTSFTRFCPPHKGIDPDKRVTKVCLPNASWEHATKENPIGVAPYLTQCLYISADIANKAQQLAETNRKFEFIGLFLSFTTLILAIFIFTHFKRLRVFRNHLHIQLMLAILVMSTVRLIIYLDQLIVPEKSKGINKTPYICETFYVLLEYAKTVAYMWMVLEGYYLHHSLVVSVFGGEPKLVYYCIIGWCVPAFHVAIWLLVVIINADYSVPMCLESYYYDKEMWILDGVRMIYIAVNAGFLANIIRVLYIKVKESHTSTETERLKKSVKAAFMLIPLLGIPNILQLIPVEPTVRGFKGWVTYQVLGTIFYMFQGFFISLLYCFTNKEVVDCLRSWYARFKMRHSDLRRGSRSASLGTWHLGSSTREQNLNTTAHSPAHPTAPNDPALKRTSSPRTDISCYTTAQIEGARGPNDTANNNGITTFEVEPLMGGNTANGSRFGQ